MKKAFLLILCVCVAFSLCACTKDGEKTTSSVSSAPPTYFDGSETRTVEAAPIRSALSSGSMDIQYESENDSVETVTVKLGMSSNEFKELVPEEQTTRFENEKYINLLTGMARVYFTNDDSPNGIVAVVQLGDIFGFSPTITKRDDVVSVMGTPENEGELESEAADSFLFGSSGATYVSYSDSGNLLRFIFTADGYLQATTISRQGLWIY